MNQEKQREIARKGGRAAHEKGTAHEFTPDEARAAGRKGGERVSSNREHMSRIGRMGGKSSAQRRSINASQRAAGAASSSSSSAAANGAAETFAQESSMPAAVANPSFGPPTISRGEHANRGETGEVNKNAESFTSARHGGSPPPGNAPEHRAEHQPVAHGNGDRMEQQVENPTPT
jgi:general stress protein YciG